MAVANLELPILILIAGVVCAVIAWLLATFTQFLRGYRYRVSLGLIAFPLGGLMGLISTLNAVSMFGDWLVGKPISYLIPSAISATWYSAFSDAGPWFGWLAGWTANIHFPCSTIWLRSTRSGTTISMRKLLIAGNWKMYKTPTETQGFLHAFLPLVKDQTLSEILICPPFVDLATALHTVKGSEVLVAPRICISQRRAPSPEKSPPPCSSRWGSAT